MDKNQRPKISICVPTYNGEKYLKETLKSILSQTYNNYEVLIVDDQSTDNTWEISKDFFNRDSRIQTYKNNENLGLVENWNRCIELASGDWIKFVFQDDIIKSDCLEKMIKNATLENPLIFCHRDFFFSPAVDIKTREFYANTPNLEDYFSKSCTISPQKISKMALNIGSNFFGEPTSTLIHKSVFNTYGLFNKNMVQMCDLEFWIRVGSNTGIQYLHEPLVTFRVHEHSTSSKNHQLANHFKTEYIDLLILLHEYVHNPLYKRIREVGNQATPKRNFKKELAKRAFWSKNYAIQLTKKNISEKSPPVLEWEKLINQYPKINTSFRLFFYKFKAWIDKAVLWRLN